MNSSPLSNGHIGDRILEELRNCPYSLPDDARIAEYVARINQSEIALRSGVDEARKAIQARGMTSEINKAQHAREIYESNAIEGAGVDSLPLTAKILASDQARRAEDALAQGMLVTSITRERKVVDVLGLNNAKILARNMVSDMQAGRMISETDIRDLHQQITDGESHAGRYKLHPNAIAGSSHAPALPIDTPIRMSELVAWIQTCRAVPATLLSAIAHAWLVHIHPFEDGNGRVARVLANMVLLRGGLPPVIINHASDRGRYIDSIALSDEAGDILPLAETLIHVQKRFVREIKKPKYVRDLVNAQIAANTARLFEGWTRAFDEFYNQLAGELAQRRIRIRRVGNLTAKTFEQLVAGNHDGDTWIGITDHDPQRSSSKQYQILLALVPGTGSLYSQIDSPVKYPSLICTVRSPTEHLDPFRNIWRRGHFDGLEEVTILPDVAPKVYVRYAGTPARIKLGHIEDAADEIAVCIGSENNRQIVGPLQWDNV